MPPRAFTNPAPKTESARSALTSFTCTLCSKSYSRHPEYEAHIGSYDHQHRKRLQDLKQLSRDPNAAEKARKAERRADAEAGLKKIDPETLADKANASGGGAKAGGGGGGGFKKSGFKSSFASVKAPAGPVRKNVLGDEEDDEKTGDGSGNGNRAGKAAGSGSASAGAGGPGEKVKSLVDVESETDEDIEGEGYYNPRKPTGCLDACAGRAVRV